jgi:aspartate aminotransferase
MPFLSDLINKIKPSATAAVNDLALKFKAQGLDIIDLSVGQPDFDTAISVKQAAINAINSGKTKYGPIDGNIELKEAIITKLKRDNNLDYDIHQIIVGNGSKQVIYNALMASINPLDEVIIAAPYWVSYPDMVLLAEGSPVITQTSQEDNFKIKLSDLEKNISDKTKWLILNSPSNPAGTCYLESELKSLAELLLKYPKIHILSDDIYEHLIFDSLKFSNIAAIEPKLKSRTLVVNGVSKAYAMTGWRIGYAASDNKELIKAMATIQSQSTSGPSSISQAAALEAIKGDQNYLKSHNKIYQDRRDFVVTMLNQIDGINCNVPNGAFYAFANCKKIFGKKTASNQVILNSTDFATYILKEARVAIVPGVAFGAEGFIRIAYCYSKDQLQNAMDRIKKACSYLN